MVANPDPCGFSGRTLAWTPEPTVVALVCSAGGLDALKVILSGLPADFPASVIVLQHARPDQPSHLVRILARFCNLPITDASTGTELRAGHALVVPPGEHALVTTDNRVALVLSNGTPPYRPSADLLLSSLAIVAGPRTIAVVLSGSGHDGATGACAVHDFGGIVLASDAASSAHFAMPSAAIERDDAVDYVLPVEKIAPALIALVDHRTP